MVPKCFSSFGRLLLREFPLRLTTFNGICPQSGRHLSKPSWVFSPLCLQMRKSFTIKLKLLGNYEGVQFSWNSARTKARRGIWMRCWVSETLSHTSKDWEVNKGSPAHLECHLTGSQLTRQTFTGWNYWRAPRQQAQSWILKQVCVRWGLVVCEGEPEPTSSLLLHLPHRLRPRQRGMSEAVITEGDVTGPEIQHRPQRMLGERFLPLLSVGLPASLVHGPKSVCRIL